MKEVYFLASLKLLTATTQSEYNVWLKPFCVLKNLLGTPDIHDYPIEDVKQQIVVPKVLPDRCRNITFAFPELEHIWGQGFDSQWSK